MPRNIQRILITTKYRFIGDTVLAVPMVRAAAQRWPEARITLLTGGLACEILQNCPYIAEAIEFDPYRKSDQGLRRYWQLVRQLRRRRFDLALILNRSAHAALTMALGGCRLRASWSGFQGRDLLLNRRCPYDPQASEIDCYLNVLRAVAPEAPTDRKLELWVTEQERSALPDAVKHADNLIGMQAGSRHAHKCWPAQHYARLVESLVEERRAGGIVLVGGPDETDSANALIQACQPAARDKIIDLTGKLSLRQTLAALSHLRLFISHDTAIRHAAVALDRPSIALFGPTSAAKWGNAQPGHLVLASETGQMADISMESVRDAAHALLDGCREPAYEGGLPEHSPSGTVAIACKA